MPLMVPLIVVVVSVVVSRYHCQPLSLLLSTGGNVIVSRYLCHCPFPSNVHCQYHYQDKVSMLVVRRFYLTLMLYRLVREHTVWNVADTFQVTRGFAQNLLASASSFASCMVRFTEVGVSR